MARSESCKLCNHDLCIEIETLKIVEGKSYRQLVKYIETVSHENKVSLSTIQRHFEKHVDNKREVQVRYLAERKKIVEETEAGVSSEVGVKLKELKHLDASIKEAHFLVCAAALEIRRELGIKIPRCARIKDERGKDTGEVKRYDKVEVSHSVVQLYKGASEELRQSAKAKMEILGFDSKTKQADAVTTLVNVLMKVDDE